MNYLKKTTSVIIILFALLVLTTACSDKTEKYMSQGDTALAQRQWNNAVTAYSQAIEEDPALSAAYCNRAYAYNELRKFDEAIEDCNKAIEPGT